MPKKKQKKFSELNSFSNVIQPGYRFPLSDHPLKGNWGSRFFFNDNPIILEIGCGKGEYTIGLAQAMPHLNFIGIDIKGNRMYTGAKLALSNALPNVGFLRIQAEHLQYFFATDEIAGIWITFPDPQLNKPRERKRLTSPRFLAIYQHFLRKDAPIHLKTDNRIFYDYTLEVLRTLDIQPDLHTCDLYGNNPGVDPVILDIKTYYESIFLNEGKKICYVRYPNSQPVKKNINDFNE